MSLALTIAAILAIPPGIGVLKMGGEAVTNYYYNKRPINLNGLEKEGHPYVQDLDVGAVTGQFRHLYRKWGYRRFTRRIHDANVPMCVVTDRPANRVLEEMTNDELYKDSSLIITNAGACAYRLADPTSSDPHVRFRSILPAPTLHKKQVDPATGAVVSEGSVQQLREVLEAVATNGGTRTNRPLGVVAINTEDSRNIFVHESTSRLTRMKLSYGLKRKNIIDNSNFDSVADDARNISFEILPSFHTGVVLGTASMDGFLKWLGLKKYKVGPNFKRWLQTEFPFPRMYKDEMGGNPVRGKNLPTYRNFLRRHKNTHVDGLNQLYTINATLAALVCYPDTVTTPTGASVSAVDPLYLDDFDVTLSTKGLEFVPHGYSKMETLKKMEPKEPVERPANWASLSPAEQAAAQGVHNEWQTEHNAWQTKHNDWFADMNAYASTHGTEALKKGVVNGDNYSDFMQPVSLRELRDRYLALPPADRQKFDPLEEFLKLSKPANGLTYDDITNIALRYNVTSNTLSSLALSAQAEYYSKVKMEAESLTAVRQKLTNISNEIATLITPAGGALSGNGDAWVRYQTLLKMQTNYTKQEADLVTSVANAQNATISPKAPYKENGNNAKSGRGVLNRVQERINGS